MKDSVTELPFNAFVGLEALPGEAAPALRLPGGGQYLNHLGSVHAGALLTLAEAASGEFLLRHFGSTAGVVPVVRRLGAKFRKPAHGAVTSTAKIDDTALTQLADDLAAKGRALISVMVDLHDEAGTYVMSATVEWFIQRTPTP